VYLQAARGDPNQVHYIPHGNFNQAYSDVVHINRSEACRRLSLPDSTPMILFQGIIREEMSVKGIERAKQFTWENAARRVLSMNNNLVRSSSA